MSPQQDDPIAGLPIDPPLSERSRQRLPEVLWSELDTPGCYLLTRIGDLLRVSEEMLRQRSERVGPRGSTRLARLSDDPHEVIPILRSIAGKHGYFVNF